MDVIPRARPGILMAERGKEIKNKRDALFIGSNRTDKMTIRLWQNPFSTHRGATLPERKIEGQLAIIMTTV
jgi:hypothetical protein